ncbi:MAG TPA: YceI family protein [Chryseosolibacter sp.]|nr:YceI family protein [Chryseosolibacter sp.]
MKKITIILLLMTGGAAAFAQTTWIIDKSHSKIAFSVPHMAVAETEGNFREFDGSIVTTAEDFNGADVSFTANTASIDTENERRDAHLKSADFFDSEKYPHMSFTGKLVKTGAKYKLVGDFTMHGVTKKVEFDVTYGGSIHTGRGQKAGFKLVGQVNRQEYGLTWSKTVPTGEMVVGDVVEIVCKIELDKKA